MGTFYSEGKMDKMQLGGMGPIGSIFKMIYKSKGGDIKKPGLTIGDVRAQQTLYNEQQAKAAVDAQRAQYPSEPKSPDVVDEKPAASGNGQTMLTGQSGIGTDTGKTKKKSLLGE